MFAEVNTQLTIIGVLNAGAFNGFYRIVIIVSRIYFIGAHFYHMILKSETFGESLVSCGIVSSYAYLLSTYCIFVWQKSEFQVMIETINANSRDRSKQSKFTLPSCWSWHNLSAYSWSFLRRWSNQSHLWCGQWRFGVFNANRKKHNHQIHSSDSYSTLGNSIVFSILRDAHGRNIISPSLPNIVCIPWFAEWVQTSHRSFIPLTK